MLVRNARCTTWIGLCLAANGCADHGPGEPVSALVDAGSPLAWDAAPLDAAACALGSARACSCAPQGTGLQTCSGGQFGACTGCAAIEVVRAKCVPGHYSGTFSMSYTPGPAGLCGIATLFGGSGSGPLEFEVISSDSAEFFEIGGGCLRGTSDAVDAGIVQLGAEIFAKGVTFKARVSGKVDCATGELKGELRGSYRSTSVCGVGLVEDDFFFKGPIHALYDPATNSFKDGFLQLQEPPVAFPISGQPGGKGSWQVARDDAGTQPSNATLEGGVGDCLDGVIFKDFELPADAG